MKLGDVITINTPVSEEIMKRRAESYRKQPIILHNQKKQAQEIMAKKRQEIMESRNKMLRIREHYESLHNRRKTDVITNKWGLNA